MSLKVMVMQIKDDVTNLLLGREEASEWAGVESDSGVLPSGANEVQMTGGAGAWADGAYTEVIADSGADEIVPFGFYCTAFTATSIHQVTMALGAAAAEVDGPVFPVAGVGFVPFKSEKVPANSRIALKTATKAGGAQTVDGFIVYHAI